MRPIACASAAGLGLLVAGCAAQAVNNRESLLSAAGFRLEPANTPERIASLQTLPPNRLLRTDYQGHVAFVYSDPKFCRCLYVGGERAYQQYQALRVQQRIANEEIEAAQMNSMDWGAWGPIGPFGPGTPWGY